MYQFQKQKNLKAAFIAENVKLLQGLEKRMSIVQPAGSKHINYMQGTRWRTNKQARQQGSRRHYQ